MSRTVGIARRRAHEVFDRIWKLGFVTRKEAYKLLKHWLQVEGEDAHIGRLSIEQCEQLISRVNTYNIEQHARVIGRYWGFPPNEVRDR